MACTQGKGLWIHTKFGFSVPRRNGKNEVLLIREMYGLVELGEHILHTAHRTTTTHAAWERLYDRLGKLEGVEIVSSYRAYGKEHIQERHRHRFEFNNEYKKQYEAAGMMCTGENPETNLVEVVEIPALKWFVGVQYHPEYNSTVVNPNPLFLSFVKAAIENKK